MPNARPDRARRRPGRRPAPARGGARERAHRTAAGASAPGETRRPRLTGRAVILVLVLAVLAVSYGSSMRAYFQQRSQITGLQEQIAEKREAIDELEREKVRWEDPAFVRAQARERFGYLMPGETSYEVLDESGNPLEPDSRLSDPSTVGGDDPPAPVYTDLWESVLLAGDPPQPKPPLNQIGKTPKRSDRLDTE